MDANLDLAALTEMLDTVRYPSPWLDVRKIVISDARYSALRSKLGTSKATPSLLTSFEVEISPICDERIAVLVGRRGELLGLFSFETGAARWFDRKLLQRFEDPVFAPIKGDLLLSGRYARYGIR